MQNASFQSKYVDGMWANPNLPAPQRKRFDPAMSTVTINGNLEGVAFQASPAVRSGLIDIRGDCALGNACNVIITYLILELEPFGVSAGNKRIVVRTSIITLLSPLVAAAARSGSGSAFVFSPGTALLGVQGRVRYRGVAFSAPPRDQFFTTTNPSPIIGSQAHSSGAITLSGVFNTRADATDVQATIQFSLNTFGAF